MAGSDSFALLQLSRNGRAWDHLHRGDGSGCTSALAWKIVRLSMDAMDFDGLLAAALHRQHRGMDDRGTRAATLADLWTDAHRQRHFSARGRRQCLVHADRLHGDVRDSGDPVAVPDLPRDRTRAGTHRASARRRCCRAGGGLKKGAMGTIWFWLVAIMLATYVLLDCFVLGAGAIHLFVAKTDDQRRQGLASIGPVWDGNEGWFVAAGGTLYFAFPALYASAFSGFYLALMIVLLLLILRGSSIEFRNHIKSSVWDPLWDFLFCASSLLLAVFFGAALGNVVRGVPLDASGYFFERLWTNFRLGDETGILDWYTILVGVLALLALMMHGGLWVQSKTSGEVNARA